VCDGPLNKGTVMTLETGATCPPELYFLGRDSGGTSPASR
jgi:hypothetical protein